MPRCPTCGINISGERNLCPLCGRVIGDATEESFDVFPKIPLRMKYNLILKISTFTMIVAIIVINIINNLFIPHLAIYVPMSLGVVFAWLILNVGFQKRKNIPKNIMYEAIISMILCIIWDKLTGWVAWSIDYVLPVTSASLVLFYFIMGIVDKSRLTSYVGYLVVSEIGIIITTVLLFLGVFEGISTYFATISIAIGAVLLLAQIVFRGKSFFSELYRWLHI